MDTVIKTKAITQAQVDNAMRTRRALSRKELRETNGLSVTPLRDAFEFFDKICPPWAEQQTIVTDAMAYVTKHDAWQRERAWTLPEAIYEVYGMEYYLPQRRFVMPFQRYVRAMNLAGNVQCLHISTFRHGNEQDQVAGQQTYQAYVENNKPRRGWLFCERDSWQKHTNLTFRDNDTYGRFLMSEYVRRTLDQHERMKQEDEKARNAQEKIQRESLETQHQAQSTLMQQNEALQEMLRQNAQTQAALLETIKTLTSGAAKRGGGTPPQVG